MLLIALTLSQRLSRLVDAGDTRSLDLHRIRVKGATPERQNVLAAADLRVVEAQVLQQVLEGGKQPQLEVIVGMVRAQQLDELLEQAQHLVSLVEAPRSDDQVACEVYLLDAYFLRPARQGSMVVVERPLEEL